MTPLQRTLASRFRWLAVPLGLATAATLSQAATPADDPATTEAYSLQSELDAARERSGLVGLSVAVMVDGVVVDRAASGLRRMGRNTGAGALLPSDAVHIGSIGKSVSATAIARLVERGVLDWSDTVGERLPELAADIDPGWREVTLDQLLGHRAALPAFGLRQMFTGDTAETEPPETRRTVMRGLLKTPPKSIPGESFAYRNSGYVLASVMAEAATGQAWESIVAAEVAEPLELQTLALGPPEGGDAAWGHRKMGPFKRAMDPAGNPDNGVFMSAAGTYRAGMDDLLRFGHAHLSGDTEYLQTKTWERLHRPVMDDYAYGWVVRDRKNVEGDWAAGPVLWHNGSNTMWYAVLALLPGRNMVIAIAANDGDIKAADPEFAALLETVAEHYPAVGD